MDTRDCEKNAGSQSSNMATEKRATVHDKDFVASLSKHNLKRQAFRTRVRVKVERPPWLLEGKADWGVLPKQPRWPLYFGLQFVRQGITKTAAPLRMRLLSLR